MIVGLCTVELKIAWANSLKDKRSEIKSLVSKVRSRFNVSIAETECQDELRRAVLGFAAVSSDRRHVDSIMNEVIRFIERNTEAELITCTMEII